MENYFAHLYTLLCVCLCSLVQATQSHVQVVPCNPGDVKSTLLLKMALKVSHSEGVTLWALLKGII